MSRDIQICVHHLLQIFFFFVCVYVIVQTVHVYTYEQKNYPFCCFNIKLSCYTIFKKGLCTVDLLVPYLYLDTG